MTLTSSPCDTLAGLTPIQLGLDVTFQLQLVWPVTATVPFPPAAGKLNDAGIALAGEGGQPTVTGMLRPPTVTVPDSPAWPEGTVTVTRLPFDTLDGLTPIQLGLELTSQLQSLGPVTDTRPRPPAAPKLNDVGDTRGIVGHGGGVTGSWVTVTARPPTPPIITVPGRPAPVSFSSRAVNVTSASPATGEGAAPSHVRFSLTS